MGTARLLLMRLLPAPLLIAIALMAYGGAARGEPAQRRTGAYSDRLLRGTTPGQPSRPKTVTVFALYALSGVGLVGATYFAVRSFDAASRADDYRDEQPLRLCSSGAETCARYSELRREQNTSAHRAWFLLGVGAVAAVSAGLTAELWHNRADGAALTISANATPTSGRIRMALRW
jgi:hypothetical protein